MPRLLLSEDESFSVNIHLSEIIEDINGVGMVSGFLVPGTSCGFDMNLSGELVYLLNNQNQIIQYTYTTQEGFYEFDALAEGSYILKAELTGKQSSRFGFTLDSENSNQSGIELEVNCDAFVGLEEMNHPEEFIVIKAYPQPATTKLTIELAGGRGSQYKYNLSNIHGMPVLKGYKINDGELLFIEIDVSRLSNGLYILTMDADDGKEIITRKILIN